MAVALFNLGFRDQIPASCPFFLSIVSFLVPHLLWTQDELMALAMWSLEI